MISVYLKDPEDSYCSGNIAWDIAVNYVNTKEKVSIHMISKAETIIFLNSEEEVKQLRQAIPKKYRGWISKVE